MGPRKKWAHTYNDYCLEFSGQSLNSLFDLFCILISCIIWTSPKSARAHTHTHTHTLAQAIDAMRTISNFYLAVWFTCFAICVRENPLELAIGTRVLAVVSCIPVLVCFMIVEP